MCGYLIVTMEGGDIILLLKVKDGILEEIDIDL